MQKQEHRLPETGYCAGNSLGIDLLNQTSTDMEEPTQTTQLVQQRVSPIFPRNPDDLTGNGHRQLLGVLGIALPILVVIMAWLRPVGSVDPCKILPSISAYYHTGAEVVFIGVVVALGIFLITYEGFGNADGRKDRRAARIAGAGALLLAVFPTEAEGGFRGPDWWWPWMGNLHLAGAATLFISFAYMSWFLFPLSTVPLTQEKVNRNRVHRLSALAIVAGLLWAFVAGFVMHRSIFAPEWLMLWAFGISWLTKGKVDRSIRLAWQRHLQSESAE